jgi:hypothetical protein
MRDKASLKGFLTEVAFGKRWLVHFRLKEPIVTGPALRRDRSGQYSKVRRFTM